MHKLFALIFLVKAYAVASGIHFCCPVVILYRLNTSA
jgi:hypothetical protein